MHCLPLLVMNIIRLGKMLEGEGAAHLLGDILIYQVVPQIPTRDKEMGKNTPN